jgi:two-component system nitrate/nitrite response regulator NarL
MSMTRAAAMKQFDRTVPMAADPKRTTRVAVIDPQPMYRAGMVRILSGRSATHLAGEGGSLAEARALARLSGVDVMIIDVALDTEFTVIAEFRRAYPEMAIVVVGGGSEVDGIASAMRAGVKGCLPRSIDGPGLIDAVDRVVKGELYVAPSMGWQLLSRLTSVRSEVRSTPPVVQFTSREEEIMHLVALGSTNKEVARKLAVSVKTVKHHLTNVMQKLRVRNRVEAVVAYHARNDAPASQGRGVASALGH